MQKKIDVVILSLNRWIKTYGCILSLEKWNKSLFNIILFDNGSNKETKKALRKLKKKVDDLRIIFNKENIGVGQGRRMGAMEGQAEYIIFLDNDMIVEKGFVKELLHTIERTGSAAVGGKVILKGKVQLCGRSIINRRIIYSNDFLAISNRMAEQFRYCDLIHGGATIYRRSAYEQVRFDENYFIGFEDLDMMMQFRKKGLKLAYCPDAVAYHYPDFGGEYGATRRNEQMIENSKQYFEKKWGVKT